MKRWLALLLAAMMAFALVACGDTPANNGDNTKAMFIPMIPLALPLPFPKTGPLLPMRSWPKSRALSSKTPPMKIFPPNS